MSLFSWEREEVDCTKCPKDQFEIISVSFGDQVITGEFVHRYNNDVREFVATDKFWGMTVWPEVKKSFVIVFRMCGNFHSKAITEGQTLVLP